VSQKKDIKTVHNYKKKDGTEGAIWTKLGVATSQDGGRWRLNFSALPISWQDGIFLMEPFKETAPAAANNNSGGDPGPVEDWG